MKLITALIPPERLEATKEELGKARIFRLTVMDVQGVAVGGAESGSGGGVSGGTAAERYGAGGSTSPKARPLVKLLVAVNEDFVEPCIGAVLRAAGQDRERALVDGRILVQPLEEVVRVRTGERGPGAI